MIHRNFLASAVVSEGEEVSSYVCGESIPQSLLLGNQVSSPQQYMICEPATRTPNSYSPNSLAPLLSQRTLKHMKTVELKCPLGAGIVT